MNNLRVLESFLNGQTCDFTRFFRDYCFRKLPEWPQPIFACSKTTKETPEQRAKYVQI